MTRVTEIFERIAGRVGDTRSPRKFPLPSTRTEKTHRPGKAFAGPFVHARAGVVAALVVGLFAGGCATTPKGPRTIEVEPTRKPQYRFLGEDEVVGEHVAGLYGKSGNDEDLRLSVYVSQPVGHELAFAGNPPEKISPKEFAVTFLMGEGVYPFTLSRGEGDEADLLTGAMVVINLDKTMELATFGYTEETRVFSPELVDTASIGVLTNYTVSFDDKPRLVYWLGNRKELFLGGDPTVELDFSSIPGIASLAVDGKERDGFVVTLPVYEDKPDAEGVFPKAEYAFSLALASGGKFRGYIRNLADNAYTAFVTVPCTIPDKLFEAALKGTISKFTIYARGEDGETGDRGESVAELVFGRTR